MNNREDNREDKRGIFFGIIGVLTLIVAIVGASLAYFSINASSETDALTVQAAQVKIVYNDGDELNVANIIPATQTIAERTFTRFLNEETYTYTDPSSGETSQVPYEKCVDDNGYNVCGVYEFEVTNNGVNDVVITAKVTPSELESEEVEFQNLKFMMYDITSGSPVKLNTSVNGDSITYTEFDLFDSGVEETVATGATKNYRLFIWLNEVSTVEEDISQDYEQGAVFRGTVNIEVAGAEKITGTAEASS